MKQSNISKIAALRKCLTSFVYTKESALLHAKDYLGNGLKFESEDVVNTRGHAAIMFTVYDENDEYRQFKRKFAPIKKSLHLKALNWKRISTVAIAD